MRRLPAGRFGAAAAVALVGCCVAGCGKKEDAAEAQPLLCYVGGTMRPAMEHLAKEYESQTGRKVQIDYAGSGILLARIEVNQRGDLYVCHDPFQDLLMRKQLGVQGWTLAVVTPTLVVQKGNPKSLQSIRDLARPGIKLGLTDPQHSTMGYLVPVIFEKAKLRKQIEANVVTRTRGGGDVANKVGARELDASIVWNAVAHLRQNKLDALEIDPEFRPRPTVDAVTSATGRRYDIGRIKVTLATLKCSQQPAEAKKFAEFVFANRGVFARDFGFTPAPSEAGPKSLLIYCGAGIRHAMADAAETFRKSTGTNVQVDYAGSGMLISRIKLASRGDLFIPGDVWYLEQIEKAGLLVGAKEPVAYFVPVIVVAKGNPKRIRSLKDLVRPGVKLAVGNPKACQIGRLCERIFAKNGIDAAAVRKSTVLSPPTVNELGVQVKMRAADAAIVWDAVAANFAPDVEIVPIPREQNLLSRVAIGVLKFSENPPLARQFVQFLTSPEGRRIFAKHHYTIHPPK